MAATAPARRLTEAEYLDFERKADAKHEFFGGEFFAMAGGSPAHSLIATNIAGELRNSLKGRSCRPYNSDLRIKVELTGLITYPDVSVICGPLQFAPGTEDTVINPTALFEVLSDSTEAYDRGNKFLNFQRIASLREYALVSQQEARIELFVRGEAGQWTWRVAEGKESTLSLPSLEITLALSEVFANVEFQPAQVRATRV